MNYRSRFVLGSIIALAISGCSTRDQNHDQVRISKDAEQDIFVSSSNLGPEAPVIVMASVPELVYQSGALVITGGRQMYVMPPSSWRAYTGMALSVEDAQRVLAASEHQQRANSEVGKAAAELAGYISEARDAGRQRRELQGEELQQIRAKNAETISNISANAQREKQQSDAATAESARLTKQVEAGKDDAAAGRTVQAEAIVDKARSLDEVRKAIEERNAALAQRNEAVKQATEETRRREDTVNELNMQRATLLQRKAQLEARERDALDALERAAKAERDALAAREKTESEKEELRKQTERLREEARTATNEAKAARTENIALTDKLQSANTAASSARTLEGGLRQNARSQEQELTNIRQVAAQISEGQASITRWTKLASSSPDGSTTKAQAIERIKELVAEQRKLAPQIPIDHDALQMIGE